MLPAIKMKFQLTILLTFLVLMGKSQDLPDSIIRKNRISKLTIHTTRTTKTNFKSFTNKIKSETIYNEGGNRLKTTIVSNDVYYHVKDSSIVYYFYQDTLLSKTYYKDFIDRKFASSSLEKYSYKFDTPHRKISQLIKFNGGRVNREEYSWNSSNNIEEVRYYSNDSAVYVPQRNGYDFLIAKGFILDKIVKNYWNARNDLSKTIECKINCRYKFIKRDSLCCTYTEYGSNRDTLTRKTRFYNEGWQTLFEKEYAMISGAFYRESQRGDKVVTFVRRNSRGLVIEKLVYEISMEGYIFESTSTYYYKFKYLR
jgi:hypothetical protein